MKTFIKILFIACFLFVFSCQRDLLDLPENNIGSTEKSVALSLTLPQSDLILTANQIAERNLPSKRYGHSAVVFNNSMWVLGGRDNGVSKNDVLSSISGSNWKIETSNAQFSPRFNHASVVFQNKIWVLGGGAYDTAGDYYELNDIWSSSNGVDWELETATADFPTRASHTVTFFNGALWLIGGTGVNQSKAICCGYSDIWRSTDGVNWTLIDEEAPFKKRLSHATVVFDNKLWVTGGDHAGGYHEVWYSSNGFNWDKIDPNPIFPKRRNHTLITDGEFLWLMAGWKILGQSNLDNTIWYSSDGIDWNAAGTTQSFPKRSDHASLFYDNKLWIIQGLGHGKGKAKNYTALSDIWSFAIPNSFNPITDFNSK